MSKIETIEFPEKILKSAINGKILKSAINGKVNKMNQNILDLKVARLSKYTGRKLKAKQAQVDKLKARLAADIPIVAIPGVGKGDRSYIVTLKNGRTFTVAAPNVDEARRAARIILGAVRALPVGTIVKAA